MPITLRVAALQLNPRIGSVANNIARAEFLLSRADLKPDILILPELAFTGYNFRSRSHLEPYLESNNCGITSQWASKTSKLLGCHTLVGYPELEVDTNKIYNSAVFTSPQGEILFNYRKAFLYEADDRWGCSEGPNGFEKFGPFDSLAEGRVSLQVGICMDLNPYKFEAPFDAFEFATSTLTNNVSLILCPMAWLHPESPNINKEKYQSGNKESHRKSVEAALIPQQPSISTVNYWFLRMSPLFTSPNPKKKIAFVACNRCGCEDDGSEYVMYAGSSSMAVFDPEKPDHHIDYKGSLSQCEEGMLVKDLIFDES